MEPSRICSYSKGFGTRIEKNRLAINNDPNFLERNISDEEVAANLEADLALVDQVEVGTLTHEAALEELIRRGSHPQLARRFLRHTLDQDKLDAERARTGMIAD